MNEIVPRHPLLKEVDRLTDEIIKEGAMQAPNSNFRLRGWEGTVAKTYIGAVLLVLHREGLIQIKEKNRE